MATATIEAQEVTRAEMRAWTAEQADAFQIATREHRLHALYVLALTTGMRQGELLGLKWAEVDLSAGTLAVRRSLQWQRGDGLAFTEPETKRSRRTIHLAQKAVAALRAHQDRQAFERRATGEKWAESDLVFCTAEGAPLSPTNETKPFQRAVTAANLPPIRFHDMRHTAASILLSRGVHIKLCPKCSGIPPSS